MVSVSHYTITSGLFNEKLQRNKYFKKSLHNSKNTAEIPPMYFVYPKLDLRTTQFKDLLDLRTKRGLTTKVLKSSFGCTYI